MHAGDGHGTDASTVVRRPGAVAQLRARSLVESERENGAVERAGNGGVDLHPASIRRGGSVHHGSRVDRSGVADLGRRLGAERRTRRERQQEKGRKPAESARSIRRLAT